MNDHKEKRVTVILPIRSGSQRLKHKNIHKIKGKPLYTFIIDTLVKCRMVEKIIINSDYENLREDYKNDRKIYFLKREKGLEGNCDINLIIKSTLNNCQGDYFLQTHVTNPLLSQKTIETAIELYFTKLYLHDSLFSVTKVQKRFWSSSLLPINHELSDEQTTQNLEPYYEENSCIYLFNRDSFFKKNKRIGLNPQMYEIPKKEAWDIDDEEDMQIVTKLID